ncbi:transposase [Rickettsiales endosymbiont of Stachyamoeba lipophora]|nr:transposase [Rickettsiales endosymbiont of Stachyamoeba lipophora]
MGTIYNILSIRSDIRSRNKSKLRNFIEAIWYIARSGCQWRLLPNHYGSWRAIHARFQGWSELFKAPQMIPGLEAMMIGSTIVRTPCL